MKIVKNSKEMNKVKLKDLCKVNLGQSPSSESYSQSENDMPFFQGAADFTEKYTMIRNYTNSPKKQAYLNDLLMTVRAPVGRINLANIDCAIGRGVCSFNFKDDSLKNYMYFYLNNLYKNNGWSGDIQGAIFEAINKEQIEDKEIKIDFKNHEKIANFLIVMENRLMKYKKILEKIEVRNQYYADILLRGELKLNKNVYIINEKFENIITEHKKSKVMAGQSLKLGLYPFFNCSKKQTLYSNEYLIDDSVLLLSTGGNPSVNYYNGKLSYSTDVWCLNSKYAKYLYYFYNTNIDKIEQCFQGGGLKHLSKKDFKKIEITIPNNDKDIQDIVDYLDNLNDEKSKVEKLLKLEEQRFEWLSDKLLSGEYIIED